MKRVVWGGAILLVLAAGAWIYFQTRATPLPPDLTGTVVFVSNRGGVDALYAKELPSGLDRRLNYSSEPAREPALSPDGRRVAYVTGGHIEVLSLTTDETKVLTFGVEWRDASPAWLPD